MSDYRRPIRILITGSRNWSDRYTVEVAIRQHALRLMREQPSREGVVVVHGGASGADACADVSARAMGFQVEVHPADWKTEGRAAGPKRNARMVALDADVCLAFPIGDSRGTRGCMELARKAGIPISNYDPALRQAS